MPSSVSSLILLPWPLGSPALQEVPTAQATERWKEIMWQVKHRKPSVRIINIKDPTGLIISGPRTAVTSGRCAPGDHYETEQDTEGVWSWWVPSEGLAQEGEKKRWQEQMTIRKRVSAVQLCPLCLGSALGLPALV